MVGLLLGGSVASRWAPPPCGCLRCGRVCPSRWDGRGRLLGLSVRSVVVLGCGLLSVCWAADVGGVVTRRVPLGLSGSCLFLARRLPAGVLGGLGLRVGRCRPARLAVVVRAFVLCPALLPRGWGTGGAGAGAGPLLQLGPPLLHAARLTVGHPGSAVRYRTVLLLGNMLQRSPLA